MAFAALLFTPLRERRFACILTNSAYLTVFPRGPHQEHQHYLMSNRSVPNLEERLKHASEAKKLMLAKFKTSLVEGELHRETTAAQAIAAARAERAGQREEARQRQERELAKQAEIAAQAAADASRAAADEAAREAAEQAERNALLEAKQKATRDARYAARKAAKKRAAWLLSPEPRPPKMPICRATTKPHRRRQSSVPTRLIAARTTAGASSPCRRLKRYQPLKRGGCPEPLSTAAV